jgi:riboflavin kinase / FMN adenylyltransferase
LSQTIPVYRSLAEVPDSYKGCALTIGNFDGVHLGHACIIKRLMAQSTRLGSASVVLTFDPHPVRILRPQKAPPPLTWTERKAELLGRLGVSAVVAYPTDESFLALSAEQFFDQVVTGTLNALSLVEGPNFYFGKDRRGDTTMLARLCEENSIALEIVQAAESDSAMISSSRIRQLIALGDVDQAAKMMTEPYRIRGIVTHGAGRGHKIGFPTANLEGIDTLLPAQGIYAGEALLSSRAAPAAIHIGPSPTFGDEMLRTEVHILDFSDYLYGQTIEVSLLKRIREVRTFDCHDALISQMQKDIQQTRMYFADRT